MVLLYRRSIHYRIAVEMSVPPLIYAEDTKLFLLEYVDLLIRYGSEICHNSLDTAFMNFGRQSS